MVFFRLANLKLKLAKWWKRDSKTTVKKCHDIYEYNFLDEYESEPEPQSDHSKFSTSDPVLDKSNVPHGAHPSRLQTAAKNLLASIRNRRERTAAALLNASMLSSKESASVNHNESKGSPNFTFQNSQDFLQTSKYYAFLQEILESKNTQRNDSFREYGENGDERKIEAKEDGTVPSTHIQPVPLNKGSDKIIQSDLMNKL